MNKIIFLVSIFSILSSQNVDLYFSLIDEGELDGVKENLPELLSKYPNDPGVLFLKAVLTDDGESALKQYKYILKNFPKSKYAPEAAMKIGEYFYARGLYTQCASLLKNIPIKYPRYPQMQRLTDLMINSFNAIGEAKKPLLFYDKVVDSVNGKLVARSGIKKINYPNFKPLTNQLKYFISKLNGEKIELCGGRSGAFSCQNFRRG